MKDFKPLIFYAQWPGVKEEDLIMEVNQLGRIDYSIKKLPDHKFERVAKFTKHQGWNVMEKLLTLGREDILEATNFKSSSGRTYTLDKLFTSLENIEFRK